MVPSLLHFRSASNNCSKGMYVSFLYKILTSIYLYLRILNLPHKSLNQKCSAKQQSSSYTFIVLCACVYICKYVSACCALLQL